MWLLKSKRLYPATLAICLALGACVIGPSAKEIKQAEIQYDLGINDMRAGRLKPALRNFLEAAKIKPDFPELQNALGLVFYLLGENEKALAYYDRALELKPDYSEVLNNKARLLIDQNHYREAIPLLHKALDNVFLKERYLAESNYGWALFQTGKKQQGYKHVKNAIAQNEKYCIGYQYLGLMYQEDKNLEDAAAQFLKITEICPTYQQANRDLGKVLLMQGNEADGCKALRACLEKSHMSKVGQDCDRLYRLSCHDPKTKAESNTDE
jgi:type IV pilus assembly protein PilF